MWWEWVIPCGVAFVSSFCLMVMELVAGRLVARHLGASLYTWTSVIGVVLTGLAVGQYVGGRLSDRYRPVRVLSVLLILASGCCLLSLPLNRWVGQWGALTELSWPRHVAVHVMLIFIWPAALLGTIAPVVAKMALDMGRQTGRTVGNVYAWGSIGSILGTFLTGYWFISSMGSTSTIGMVGVLLAILGVGLAVRSWLSRVWAGTMMLIVVLLLIPTEWARAATVGLGLRERRSANVLYQSESAYSFIKVAQVPDEKEWLSLTLDQLIHSYVSTSDATRLHYDYERLYAVLTRRFSGGRSTQRTLFLGGGGYVFPRYVERFWPGSRIEVAEIDPEVTNTARRWLGLAGESRIHIRHLDARNCVEDLLRMTPRGGSEDRFDFIYGDAFNDYVIPFHLVTVEFNERLKRLLSPDGVYMLNVIDILASGRFLGAVVNTLRRTFKDVQVYRSRVGLLTADPYSRETFVVVAGMGLGQPLTPTSEASIDSLPGVPLTVDQMAMLDRRNGGRVLTDDYAPVEELLAPVFGETVLTMPQKLNDIGLALATKGQYDQAIDFYHRALRLRPDFSEARSNLGWALYQRGDREGAIEMLRRSVQEAPNLASAQNNLGWALYGLGRHTEAIAALRQALQCKPDFALAHNNLGMALAGIGQIEEALGEYRQATRLQPAFAEAHYNLAIALSQLTREDEAIVAYKHVLSLNPQHQRAHNNLGWLLYQKGRHSEAEAELRQALAANPLFIRAMNNLGQVLTAQGRFDEAVAMYARLLQQEPGHVEACNNLGIALAKQGKGDKAVQWFKEALKFRPGFGPALDNLMAYHLRKGEYAEAIGLLRSSIPHAGDRPGVYSNLALLLAACPVDGLRNGEEAVRLAKEANELSGGRSARVLDSLAAAQAETGQFDKAVSNARGALELAKSLGNRELEAEIAARLKLYESRRPYRITSVGHPK